MDDSVSVDTATQIAAQLGETEEVPRRQIQKIVEILGPEQSLAYLEKSIIIEQQGGLRLNNGRRRTLGGVFFALVRQDAAPELQKAVFSRRPDRRPPPVSYPPFRWADYGAILIELQGDVGVADALTVEVKGRPGRVIDREKVVIVRLDQQYSGGTLPGVSSDIPLPSRIPSVPCVVLIRRKSWSKIKEALLDPQDRMIAKGPAYYDGDNRVLTIAATTITTINTEKERRRQQAESKES